MRTGRKPYTRTTRSGTWRRKSLEFAIVATGGTKGRHKGVRRISSHDEAGNLTRNSSGEPLKYDAENRMIAFCTQDPGGCPNTAGIGRTLYVYDGEGRRVLSQKADGAQTVYAYDAFGNLAAEYSTGAPAASGTQYVMGDHLDSARLVMTGSDAGERHDYLPFGQEYDAAAGNWRLGGGIAGYGTDPIRQIKQKFTGQVRDGESSLDYFRARYYSPAQGRFLSVDPGNAGASLGDPQSWNGYAYVSNNPMNYTDPDGLGFWSTLFDGSMWIGRHILPFLGAFGGAGGSGGGLGSVGANDGPWNEQLPISGGMVPLNTGTVFGSGNTGPFIFSLDNGTLRRDGCKRVLSDGIGTGHLAFLIP